MVVSCSFRGRWRSFSHEDATRSDAPARGWFATPGDTQLRGAADAVRARWTTAVTGYRPWAMRNERVHCTVLLRRKCTTSLQYAILAPAVFWRVFCTPLAIDCV